MSKVVARRSAKTSGLVAPKEQGPEDVILRQMEVRDAAAVFHLGEEGKTILNLVPRKVLRWRSPPSPNSLPLWPRWAVFNSSSFPQLYRTWDPFEVTETLAADAELCLVAEEVSLEP
jgi:hypothetical protein